VSIVSSGIDARPPASVTIGGGNRSVIFAIPTAGVSNPEELVLTAGFSGQGKTAPLRLENALFIGGGGGGGGGGG
jgi:hypothetical protein